MENKLLNNGLIKIKSIKIKNIDNDPYIKRHLNLSCKKSSSQIIKFSNSVNVFDFLKKNNNNEENSKNSIFPKIIENKPKIMMNKKIKLIMKPENISTPKFNVKKKIYISSTHLNKSEGNLINQNNELEKYSIGKIIGHGAQANVRLCKNKCNGNSYCMKIYNNIFIQNKEKKLAIEKEISILKEISHPNIIKFIEKIYSNHTIYLILECANGITLKSYMKNQLNQRLNEVKTKKIFIQLISALSYLHNKNICHRDIKLENIIINEKMNIKIIDLGLGIHFQQNKKLNLYCGTPFFMAPEILKKKEYFGPSVDVWSAGIVLYNLLCGKLPFKALNEKHLIQIISNGYIDFPNFISNDAKDLIKKMLCVNPLYRISSNDILKHQWLINVLDLFI